MFKIGLYEREITPLFGNNLCGYFNARPVSGVKDKTYAKAVVLKMATSFLRCSRLMPASLTVLL